MKICYVDESGCTGALPSATSDVQPLFAILGLIIPQEKISDFTFRFLHLKQKYFPRALLWNKRAPREFLDWILFEPKGGDLRKNAADPSKRVSRHAIKFLDEVLGLVEANQCRLIGRVWVKGIGEPFAGPSIYTSSIQRLCEYFDHLLATEGQRGLLVADSRATDKNSKVSHSVFTQRFRAKGNAYPNLLEMPLFGNSENHAGLQVCDLICSGILNPIAIHSYCVGHMRSTHIRPGYQWIKEEFAKRIEQLQHRYLDSNGKWTGGVACSDAIAKRSGKLLFQI